MAAIWASSSGGNPPDKPKDRDVEFFKKEVLREEVEIYGEPDHCCPTDAHIFIRSQLVFPLCLRVACGGVGVKKTKKPLLHWETRASRALL